MKTWYLTKSFIATIYLSLNSLTVISFDAPIDSYFLGTSKEYVFSALSKDRKSLILKAQRVVDTNLFVATSGDQYSFNLRNGEKATGAISIKRARRDNTYQLFKREKDYSLFVGDHGRLKVFKTGETRLLSKVNE